MIYLIQYKEYGMYMHAKIQFYEHAWIFLNKYLEI
jgi:hypothetical protein